jgi:DNA polymerase delta subunit 1
MSGTAPKRQLNSTDSAAAKKRKVDGDLKNNRLAKLSKNQPKSGFEEELENLSQEISGLKNGNAETDQKWARPDLDPSFDPQTDNLIFQQIDVEDGNLGGKPTVRLFGVTEVSVRRSSCQNAAY